MYQSEHSHQHYGTYYRKSKSTDYIPYHFEMQVLAYKSSRASRPAEQLQLCERLAKVIDYGKRCLKPCGRLKKRRALWR